MLSGDTNASAFTHEFGGNELHVVFIAIDGHGSFADWAGLLAARDDSLLESSPLLSLLPVEVSSDLVVLIYFYHCVYF